MTLIKCEVCAYFSAMRGYHTVVMVVNDIHNVPLISNLPRVFVLVAVITESQIHIDKMFEVVTKFLVQLWRGQSTLA